MRGGVVLAAFLLRLENSDKIEEDDKFIGWEIASENRSRCWNTQNDFLLCRCHKGAHLPCERDSIKSCSHDVDHAK
jgi:hypothetical protein